MNGNAPPSWRIIVFALLGATALDGALPLLAPTFTRPDPYTGTQARHMVEQHRREMAELRAELRREMLLLLSERDQTIPPTQVRQRIRGLESWIMQRDPKYTPPTEAWRPQYIPAPHD